MNVMRWLLFEQAGGMASDGHQRVMEILPQTLHQRVPFYAGSMKMVQKLEDFTNGS